MCSFWLNSNPINSLSPPLLFWSYDCFPNIFELSKKWNPIPLVKWFSSYIPASKYYFAPYCISFLIPSWTKIMSTCLDIGFQNLKWCGLLTVSLTISKKLLKLCEANGSFYVKAGQFFLLCCRFQKNITSTFSCLHDIYCVYFNIHSVPDLVFVV
jgi:hypothetical protein